MVDQHDSGPQDARPMFQPMATSTSGEWYRWFAGLILAGFIAYFTTIATQDAKIADVKAASERDIAIVKTTQENQFEEVLRRLVIMQADIRELRRGDLAR